MPKPPPPPRPKPAPPPQGPPPRAPEKAPAASLEEVERALSVLHGRHPEAVRVERETQAALSKKRAATDELAARAAREDRRRLIQRLVVGTSIAAVAFGVGFWGWRRTARASAVAASLAPAMAPYAARGFAAVPASRFGSDSLELTADEPTCFVALSSRSPGDGSLRVDRPSGTLDGEDSVAWCTCGAERATVTLGSPDAKGGLSALRVPASEIGGDYGLYFLVPRPRRIASPDECSAPSLDAWIEKGQAAILPDDHVFGGARRERARDSGFEVVSSASASLPFAVVPGRGESCILAWSSEPSDALSLRVAGGTRPLADVTRAIGTCGSAAQGISVWHKGEGDLVVVRAKAARVGGLHGLREAASRLGLGWPSVWAAGDDLAWDASQTLRASGVAAPEIATSTTAASPARPGLLALSVDGASVRTEGSPSAWVCEPPLAPGYGNTVCVESAPLKWRVAESAGRAGIAESPLPFWMSGLASISDSAVLPVELSLLKLGRSLAALGFEATTL
jgi:hypothetical protein